MTNYAEPDKEEPDILPKVKKPKKLKKQSKLASFLESLSNELLGYLINTLVQIIIFPLIGFHLSLGINLLISAIHSAFGLTRIYIIRRFFDRSGKKQNKRSSLYESILNIVMGTVITFTVQPFIFLLFGIVISAGSNLSITAIYLVITLVRLYVLRRFFNNKTKAAYKAKKAAKKLLKAHKRESNEE